MPSGPVTVVTLMDNDRHCHGYRDGSGSSAIEKKPDSCFAPWTAALVSAINATLGVCGAPAKSGRPALAGRGFMACDPHTCMAPKFRWIRLTRRRHRRQIHRRISDLDRQAVGHDKACADGLSRVKFMESGLTADVVAYLKAVPGASDR